MARKRKKVRKKRARGVKFSKNQEVKYRNKLVRLTKKLTTNVTNTIAKLLKKLETEYISDDYVDDLEKAFNSLRNDYNDMEALTKKIVSNFVEGTNSVNKKRFYSAIDNAVGIDLTKIVRNENLEPALKAATRENVTLIKSIPDEYFKKMESIVFGNVIEGVTAKSMIDQIKELNMVTTNRARLIARDQTSKLNAALSRQRQLNLGIEEYIWRTSQDGNRVRPTHRANNGKTFRWDSPSAITGHPGQDVQCRCTAEPIINL